eukprot:205724-Amphidinium_carterae.1
MSTDSVSVRPLWPATGTQALHACQRQRVKLRMTHKTVTHYIALWLKNARTENRRAPALHDMNRMRTMLHHVVLRERIKTWITIFRMVAERAVHQA